MVKKSKMDWLGETNYKPPPPQICANCGKSIPGSDLALISQAILNRKPVCSYECNKALGQV